MLYDGTLWALAAFRCVLRGPVTWMRPVYWDLVSPQRPPSDRFPSMYVYMSHFS